MSGTFRDRFSLPASPDGKPLVYFAGHSLGPAPRAARDRVVAELADWEHLAVLGHHSGPGERPGWIDYAQQLVAGLAALTGARDDEVVAMNALTVNLHFMLASFYAPRGARTKILIEAGAFPSDRHAVESQLRWHGLDPAEHLVELAPVAGELVEEEQIEALLRAEGERYALVLWPGVQFRTGQCFDLARIVRAARSAGVAVGFDLAHSIGNVPLSLHDWAPDFAVWCSYKYLNAGPGAIGGAFVAAHHGAGALPRLAGWWGHERGTRFAMAPDFVPDPLAAGWQVSNPPILSAAPLLASLEIFSAAGTQWLAREAPALTAYAHELIGARLQGKVQVITPTDPRRRGAQLSLRIPGGAQRGRDTFAALERAGVVADWRSPDIIRIAPIALFNTRDEITRAVEALAAVLQ